MALSDGALMTAGAVLDDVTSTSTSTNLLVLVGPLLWFIPWVLLSAYQWFRHPDRVIYS